MAKLSKLYRDGPVDGPRRPDLRTRQDVAAFFDGMELVEPGVVTLPAWRPEHDGR